MRSAEVALRNSVRVRALNFSERMTLTAEKRAEDCSSLFHGGAVNQDGEVYEQDLGSDTAQKAGNIAVFNPDKDWEKADMTP